MISKIEDAILDEVGIDEADKLEIRAALEKVASGEATEGDQITLWNRIKSTAPNAWSIAQGIVVNVASATIKKELGL